jgi:hypothetical protein
MARAFLHPCAREAGVRCRRLAVDYRLVAVERGRRLIAPSASQRLRTLPFREMKRPRHCPR